MTAHIHYCPLYGRYYASFALEGMYCDRLRDAAAWIHSFAPARFTHISLNENGTHRYTVVRDQWYTLA